MNFFEQFALKLGECAPLLLQVCPPPSQSVHRQGYIFPSFSTVLREKKRKAASCVAIAFFFAAHPLPSHSPSRSVFGTAESLMRPLFPPPLPTYRGAFPCTHAQNEGEDNGKRKSEPPALLWGKERIAASLQVKRKRCSSRSWPDS